MSSVFEILSVFAMCDIVTPLDQLIEEWGGAGWAHIILFDLSVRGWEQSATVVLLFLMASWIPTKLPRNEEHKAILSTIV